MDAGYVISGTGHAALIGWALLGGVFSPSDPPEPPPALDVSLVTEAELAALSGPPQVAEAAQPGPEAAPDLAEEPVAPEVEIAEPAPEAPAPAPEPEPEPAPAPEVAEVEPAPAPEPEPDLPSETAILVPESEPVPAERIAPEVAPAPPEDAAPAETAEAAEEAPAPEAEPLPEAERSAPEEAGTVIAAEAPEPVLAPEASIRPPQRPSRPAAPEVAEAPEPVEPAPAPAPEAPAETAEAPDPAPAPETPSAPAEDPLAALLAEAMEAEIAAPAAPRQAPAPTGPPLTGGEKDALRVSVQQCWNLGTTSSEAMRTTVVVTVDMNEDGTPRTDTIRMASFEGPSQAGADTAFQAARRAIIRCGARGFPLPREKFSQWAQIEMTFNPDGMRVR